MKKILSMIFGLTFVLSVAQTIFAADDFADANQAAAQGNMAEAIRLWTPLAQKGNAKAQYKLGLVYENGHGIKTDLKQAARWYSRAAESGHPAAQVQLARLYLYGKGVPKSVEKAIELNRKAAEKWHPAAMYELGVFYQHGEGVPVEIPEAMKWYERAANQGVGGAQFNLAALYMAGVGVRKNLEKAYFWLTLAAIQDDQEAALKVKELERLLPPSRIDALDGEVKAWLFRENAQYVDDLIKWETISSIENGQRCQRIIATNISNTKVIVHFIRYRQCNAPDANIMGGNPMWQRVDGNPALLPGETHSILVACGSKCLITFAPKYCTHDNKRCMELSHPGYP